MTLDVGMVDILKVVSTLPSGYGIVRGHARHLAIARPVGHLGVRCIRTPANKHKI